VNSLTTRGRSPPRLDQLFLSLSVDLLVREMSALSALRGRRYAEDDVCARTRSLMDQKRCSLEPVRRLLQLSALFHEGGQIVELINLATFAPAGLLLASVPSCSLARVVVRPRLAEFFAPLWLSLVVKDRFIKRAH
jgi:hypothetical protein